MRKDWGFTEETVVDWGSLERRPRVSCRGSGLFPLIHITATFWWVARTGHTLGPQQGHVPRESRVSSEDGKFPSRLMVSSEFTPSTCILSYGTVLTFACILLDIFKIQKLCRCPQTQIIRNGLIEKWKTLLPSLILYPSLQTWTISSASSPCIA